MTTKNGWKLTYFPCMSEGAKKSVREKVKKVVNRRFFGDIQGIAQRRNSMSRGWINYYCVYSKWTVYGLWYWVNLKLVRWVMERKMMGDYHVRCCERFGVKFPLPTRHI